MNQMEHYTLRLPGELKTALIKLAKRQHRTLSDAVRLILHKAVNGGK